MEVPEVKLWSGIVAGEDLIVVEHDCVHLVRVVELGAPVLVDDKGQE